MVVGDDGLHNGQSETGAVLLGGVVGREQALALLGGEAGTGVDDAQLYRFAL